MASGSASSPRPAPDENEFPFGCPPTICQNPAEPKPLCCTVCLPENVRNGEDQICPKCKGDDTPSESPGSLLSQEKDHPEVAEAGVGCPFAGVGCSFKGSPKFIQEHEVTSQATHLNLLLGFMKQWKAQLGSVSGSGPMALEQNLSDLQLQGAVEVAGDLEVDCYRAPCSESQEEQALQHFMKEKLLTELEGKLCVFENIVAVLNKEVEASNLALAASIHQSQLDREHIQSLEQRVIELQQTLAQKDQALGKLEQSLRLLEEASFDGTFLWKITNVTRRCHESACGRTVSLFSPGHTSPGAQIPTGGGRPHGAQETRGEGGSSDGRAASRPPALLGSRGGRSLSTQPLGAGLFAPGRPGPPLYSATRSEIVSYFVWTQL
uniref:TNF receptor-associated factor BIRC3 binding domain-containing protein n=1 Tax=Sus scrofa TaxID=9823 RepID=A0A8D2BXJ9_PIG